MKAVIVAAGLSSRLRPLTNDLPKGLLEVGGETILERSITNLEATGHDEIVVVVGFLRERIQDRLGERVSYVHNPFYETTNNMASLWFALVAGGAQPVTYVHGDLVYSRGLLERFIQASAGSDAALSVEMGPTDDEAMKVKVDGGRFVESNKQIPLDEAASEWTGLTHFSQRGSQAVREHIDELLGRERFQDYDTAAFTLMASRGFDFQLIATDGEPWCEVDTEDDLQAARCLFPDRR